MPNQQVFGNTAIKTFYSSRTEALLGMLLQQLQDHQHPDPFLLTPIIVPNSGMQRYLTLRIAEAFGICSHYKITTATAFLHNCYQNLLGEDPYNPVRSFPDNRQLALRLLWHWQDQPTPHPDLAELLSHYAAPGQRYSLARRLATLLSYYLQERPALIEAWQRGKLHTDHPHEDWQLAIFTELGLGEFSRTTRQRDFQQALQQRPPALPAVYLFGFHALPPGQLADFSTLAAVTEVNAYIFNPSPNYWLTLVPESVKLQNLLTQTAEAELMQVGNPLLAAWGQSGKYLIEQLNAYTELNTDDYSHTPSVNALTWLQNRIRLADEQPPPATDKDAEGVADHIAAEISSQHFSLSLHLAASPRREVEILYDNLCRLFVDNTSLSPADILVMVPDLRDYAAHIAAVFGHTADDRHSIPFSMANQSLADADSEVKALLALLNMLDSDFSATALFDALSEAVVSDTLQLSPEHLNTFRSWFSDSRFAAQFHDTSDGQFSSLAKLIDMLLLAAVGGAECQLGNRVALPSYHPTQYDSLLCFCRVLEFLEPFADLRYRRQTLSAWAASIHRLCDTFLGEHQQLGQQLTAWAEAFEHEQLATPVFTYDTIVSDLRDFLHSEELHGPFLSGGVSFCAMVPMRSIPAKVICLLGMNQGFPALTLTDPLDLRQIQPLWSDKNAHRELSYCFLETLMAARQQLYISYVGEDEKSGEALPPSVLVAELSSFINRHFPAYIDAATHTYPLQGFLPDKQQRPTYQSLYSQPSPLATDVAAAAAADGDDNGIAVGNFAGDGVAPPTQMRAKTFADAINQPFLFYLQRHLAAAPILPPDSRSSTMPLCEHDTLSPASGLEQWAYRQAWLAEQFDANSSAAQLLQQQNRYAPHSVSQAVLANTAQELSPLAADLRPMMAAQKQPLSRFIVCNGMPTPHYLLLNTSQYSAEHGLWNYATSALNAQKLMRIWVEHVLLNHLPELPNHHSRLLTLEKDGSIKHTQLSPLPPDASRAALLELWQLLHTLFAVPAAQVLHLAGGKLFWKPQAYPLYPSLHRQFVAWQEHHSDSLDRQLQSIADTLNKFWEPQS